MIIGVKIIHNGKIDYATSCIYKSGILKFRDLHSTIQSLTNQSFQITQIDENDEDAKIFKEV